MRTPISFARSEAREALLITRLAIQAYHAEQSRYPQTLAQLVPEYLSKGPLDPYSNQKPLIYKPVPLRYVRSTAGHPPREPIMVQSDKWMPFTLYSVGPDSRDDGGNPYENTHYKAHTGTQADRNRYNLAGDFLDSKGTDVVAGINR